MRREALVRFDGGSPGQRPLPLSGRGDNPGVRSDGDSPKNGGDRDTPLKKGRGGTKRVRIPPAGRALRCACNAAGVGTSDLSDQTDRAEYRRPGDRPKKRRPGRAQPREARNEALASEARRRRCRTANSPPRGLPESFCVLLGENSWPLWARGDYAGVTPRTYGVGVE